MNAELKNILLVDDFTLLFKDYTPENSNNFHITLSLEIGLLNEESSDIFDVDIINILNNTKNDILFKNKDIMFYKGFIVIEDYNYEQIIESINLYISKCTGESWDEIAKQLSKVFTWEYEDYS